jgi:hypothetical protein
MMESRVRRSATGLICILFAAVLWIPCVRFFFDDHGGMELLGQPGISPYTRSLAARHLAFWSDPALREHELSGMRKSNAEWDFMGRTYFVLALANIALRDAAMKPRALEIIDHILEETLRLEAQHGLYHFSMDYARTRPYREQPARSQFVDSEIALMLGARRLIEEKESWREPLRERVRVIVDRMKRSPSLSAESYPDECWTFDNANALAALRIADALDGSDHRPFCREWIEHAKRRLVDPGTGILVSEYTLAGSALDGPEGSSIWMVAHALQIVDEPFACDQYDRARRELRRSICGFDVSREWPVGRRGEADIDSGIVIPIVDASPGASGMALMGASAFKDAAYFRGLLRSLEMAAFPIREKGMLRYAASNQVGDAVLLYSTVLGPLWAEVKRRVGP